MATTTNKTESTQVHQNSLSCTQSSQHDETIIHIIETLKEDFRQHELETLSNLQFMMTDPELYAFLNGGAK